MIPQAHTRFLPIDVLRGLAALAVLFSHYFPYWDRYAAPIPVLVPNVVGYYAVSLFFVISGFVIFVTLERCRTPLDFAVLRFSRLYPVYWASLLLVAAVGVFMVGQPLWLGGFFANATMLQQFFGYTHFDNVYWSLEVELTFYCIVGVLFALRIHERVNAFLLAWLALAALWVIALKTPGSVTSWSVVATDRRDMVALLSAFDYCPYFAIGILGYRAIRHGWTLPAAGLVAFAFVVEFLLASWEGVAVMFAITLVFWAAVNQRLRFLVNDVTLWLGAISYSLYLTHRNLGYYMLSWMHDRGVGAYAAIAIALAGSLLVATALTYGIERPASAAIRSWYRVFRSARAGVPAASQATRDEG